MKGKKIGKIIILTLVLIGMCTLVLVSDAAVPEVELTPEGNLEFYTTDRTATSSTTWTTIGFHITREKSVGGDPTKVDHAKLMLAEGEKKEDISGSVTNVFFSIPEKKVSNALLKAGFDGIQQDDIIYLHGIHQVMHGNVKGKIFYDKAGIMGAEKWAKPDDFNDRFDLRVPYKSPDAPIIKRYITTDGKQIGADEVLLSRKPGFESNVTMKTKIDYKGEELYLSKTYVSYYANPKKRIVGTTKFVSSINAKDYESQLEEVKKITQVQVPGGIIYYAVMRPKTSQPDITSDEYSLELELPNPYGIIAADDRYGELFDVTEGIPTTEDLYTNVFSNHYIFGFKLQKVVGTKSYPVTVKKTFTLTWEEEDPVTKEKTPKSTTETVSQAVTIKREFSFWKIINLDYYGINYATIKNYALPGGEVKLTPKNYTTPTLTHWHSAYQADHMIEPTYQTTMIMPSETVPGGSSKPSIPSVDYKSYAEARVDEILVKNDNFIFDGQEIINDGYVEKQTQGPKEIDVDNDYIDDDVLYGSDLKIALEKINGDYPTIGNITYKVIKTLSKTLGENPTYDVSELNNVVIHTPTYCNGMIENKTSDNQMINPRKDIGSLVLDLPFKVIVETEGPHRDIQGYGYDDYAKYTSDKEVMFPFDVYKGLSGSGSFVPKNTWTSVDGVTQFYLPIWVTEGIYTVNYRSIAINAKPNNKLGSTEKDANLNLQNYVAIDSLTVEVSGRIYDFSLYDITDYPMWETVFREKEGTVALSGFKYTVGTKDQNGNDNGQNSRYTLTLVNGSHPQYKNIGAVKTGYKTRFSLTTIGTMYGPEDYIKIKPTFYYVDYEGKNRQEVDVYYNGKVNGEQKTLVKMGGEKDIENVKKIRTGDPFLAIDKRELHQTAVIQGMTREEFESKIRKVWTFKHIMIPENLRTFVGYEPIVPPSVEEHDIAKSKQHWYGEYYFPADINVAPKDFDVFEYWKESGSLNLKEDFWLKDGYIIVNFQIETLKNREKHLSYINPTNSLEGYCNMWNREGFQYEKVDWKGNEFSFEDGDYMMYYTDRSVKDDWTSSGTH